MSLPRGAIRNGVSMWGVAAVLTLAGCTGLTPLYGDHGPPAGAAIRTDAPRNLIERLIYQDLALKLGSDRSGSAPKLTISASQSSVALTNGTVSAPSTQRQMIVSASVKLVDATGRVLYSGTLSQTADFTAGRQVLANQQAEADAAANAVHLLADTIRLKVLATLAQ